jgi:hypothetical protein
MSSSSWLGGEVRKTPDWGFLLGRFSRHASRTGRLTAQKQTRGANAACFGSARREDRIRAIVRALAVVAHVGAAFRDGGEVVAWPLLMKPP